MTAIRLALAAALLALLIVSVCFDVMGERLRRIVDESAELSGDEVAARRETPP